jgi:hypothetical protein
MFAAEHDNVSLKLCNRGSESYLACVEAQEARNNIEIKVMILSILNS